MTHQNNQNKPPRGTESCDTKCHCGCNCKQCRCGKHDEAHPEEDSE